MKCKRADGAKQGKDGSRAAMIRDYGNPTKGTPGLILNPQRPSDWPKQKSVKDNRIIHDGYVWQWQQDQSKPAGGYWRKAPSQATLSKKASQRAALKAALPAAVRAAMNSEHRLKYPEFKRGKDADHVAMLASTHMIDIADAGRCTSGCSAADYPMGDYLASAAKAGASKAHKARHPTPCPAFAL